MRIRLALPEQALHESERKEVLDAALEAVTRAATPLVARRKVPTAAAAIKAGRVRWKPEPPGDEHFDLPSTVLARGWGDCDDLAPWHAASLRASGVDPRARAVVKKSGPARWHALVKRGDGSIEDPSVAAGMGSGVSGYGGYPGVVGALADPMFPAARLATAVYPLARRGWAGRCDIRDRRLPWHWSALTMGMGPAAAAARAIRSAHRVAGEGFISDWDSMRLGATHDLLMGADPDEVAEALEQMGVLDFDNQEDVGFFGGLLKAAGSLVKGPLGNIAASVIPGGGLIKSGIEMASSLVPGGKGRPAAAAPGAMPATPGAFAPGAGAVIPPQGGQGGPSSGPIIVRF
jgi:hypothetical protein